MNKVLPIRILFPILFTAAMVLPGLAVSVAFARQDPGPPADERSDPRDESVARVYRIDHLDTHDAALRAQQICLERPGERQCEYRIAGKNWFTFYTDPATQEMIAAEFERLDVAPRSLNFRLVLLLAQEESVPDPNLPPGEMRALEDLKQFLPYRGYRLLDSGWIRAEKRANLRLGSDPAFNMSMNIERVFSVGSSEIRIERFELEKAIPIRTQEGYPSFTGHHLIGSSFSMQVGETVVVGTSKLNGDSEALVVLLTAAE
jgi:hypothetical protein